MGEYVRPTELGDLFAVMEQRDWKILAGGTDYYPGKVGRALSDDILDITNIDTLKEIRETEDDWHIGATVKWSNIIAANLPQMFDGLKAAAKEIGGRQIQNAGTLGGNVCNASPAADGMPALISLGAIVEISDGVRNHKIPIENFVVGNRAIQLNSNQILTKFIIPKVKSPYSSGKFLKLGARQYLVISLAMVSGVLGWNEDGIITHCKMSVGACSEVAKRLQRLETLLIGQPKNSKLSLLLSAELFSDLQPIDDVRATSEYRQIAARNLVGQLLDSWGDR